MSKLTIIGAGPAGLSVGYFAKQEGIEFTILEAGKSVGGNCKTIEHNGFKFDTGAHRFHDKDEEATRLVKSLLGDELQAVKAPSSIYFKSKKIDFPLSPLNVLSKLSLSDIFKGGMDYLAAQLSGKKDDSFEARAIGNYGKTIADYFLLNYSEKLWGIPCSQLLPETSGSRLKGLTFSTFFKEVFQDKNAKTQHIDGAFYYPKNGYGSITDSLANACGDSNIQLEKKLSVVHHQSNRITSIEINGKEALEIDELLSSMPVSSFLKAMSPQPTIEVLQAAESLRFRNVILVSFLLDKESVTTDATTYYPEEKYPFTRIYEPRNRSELMAPKGKTSLVVEIPCWETDEVWSDKEQNTIQSILPYLLDLGLFKTEELIEAFTMKMPHAYPVLEKGVEDKLSIISSYLNQFENLTMLGRNGGFTYTHLHDMIGMGKEVVQGLQKH